MIWSKIFKVKNAGDVPDKQIIPIQIMKKLDVVEKQLDMDKNVADNDTYKKIYIMSLKSLKDQITSQGN